MHTPASSRAALLAVAILASPFIVVTGIAMAAAGAGALDATTGASCTVDADGVDGAGDFDDDQVENAAIIHQVAQDRELPARASIIAIATALQESTLTNHGHLGDQNDHDSLGLFQQRPSTGWGSPEELTDPEYAAGKFYDALEQVDGWENLPLTVAAQTVQKSAFPDAYAKWEGPAEDIVASLSDVTTCNTASGSGDWVPPIDAEVGSGYRTSERPDHDGVDFMADHGTPILAAGDGEVVTVVCNASTPDGAPYTCDQDGSPQILGCGWYVEIHHPDDTLTRYCHMVERPDVEEGQSVTAGTQIGKVGSSGNSSGPHLHFETHSGHPPSFETAQEPLDYLAERGVGPN